MVDIIVTTYNRLELLKKMLDSLFKTTSLPYRLFISDDASTDGTPEYLQSLRNENLIQILINKRRSGITYGFNQLWNLVDLYDSFYEEFPYLCYLQDDIQITEDGWLNLLIEAYEALRDEHNIGFFCGYHAPDHPQADMIKWNDRIILFKKSSRMTNLIAEKKFWRSIGYVPRLNPDGSERGFPNAHRGSQIDLWFTGCMSGSRQTPNVSAPNSSCNQGKKIMVIPGLIEHGAEWKKSTWRHG